MKPRIKKGQLLYQVPSQGQHFPSCVTLQIESNDCNPETHTIEIHGRAESPIPITVESLKWSGHFNGIKKLVVTHLELCPGWFEGVYFPCLENLVLKNITFKNSDAHELLEVLPKKLKNLSLIHCLPFLAKVEKSFDLPTTLEQLDISKNQLTLIPPWVSTLTSLRRLTLDGNKLEYLPTFLKSLPKLNHLSADDNPFSDQAKAEIQRTFNLWF